MNPDIVLLFGKMPGTFPLYEALERHILHAFEGVTVKAAKTQVSFFNKHGFAYASLPIRRKKGWPEVCIVVTFGLGYELKHPRIVQAVEPHPNRWTHHVLVAQETDIDEQLMDWIAESYAFSMQKR